MSGSEENIVTPAVGNFLHFKLCGVRPGSTGTAVHVAVRPNPFVGNWKRIKEIVMHVGYPCLTNNIAVRLDSYFRNCQIEKDPTDLDHVNGKHNAT